MTEAEWLAATAPAAMLYYLLGGSEGLEGEHGVRASGVTDRKLFLFVAAVERLWWGTKAGKLDRKSLELMEAIADGRAEEKALRRVAFSYSMPNNAANCAWECVRIHNSEGDPPLWAALLRDIFSPFARVRIEPAWLAWGSGTVAKLAHCIYEERNFDALAVLADALEEAGCGQTFDQQTLLWHLRGREVCPTCRGLHAMTLTGWAGPAVDAEAACNRCKGQRLIALRGPHVRGCWAVDLLTGRA